MFYHIHRCLLRSLYRLGSSLANNNVKCDWLQRALRKTLVDLVIPSAMVNLVRGVRDAAGSIPSEAATCLEAVARWRGAEVNTRGDRISPPAWNFVAADLCDLCVDLSSVDDTIVGDDWDSSRYDRVCVRLNALGGVARGLASVAVDATDFEKIGSAISVSIVNLEKVITAVTASRHEPTRVGDARTAGWTAAAALLSVPIGKGGGPIKSESLSALASAATVRLLDDALEGLPAVSQNASPGGSTDEPSHRLLAGLRAVHRLVEVVVPMYPGEPESGLGRKIAIAVEKSVKSSRFRKNAPAWAAATACVLHPRLFGSSPRMHSRDASDGSSSCAIDGVGACAWFVSAAVKSGGKSGGSRILRVVSHALAARLVRWPEHARHYAREVWALGLSGEGGFTRAERLAMAQHWHEREVAAEVLTSNGGKNTYGDDAGALADWLEDGGCGGAAGGHVAARVAALSLAHALARAEAPTGSSDGSNNGRSSDDSSAGSRVVSAESYRAAALDGAEALLRHGLNAVSGGDSDLTRDTYRRGSITHRRKVRAWQMLCALTPAIDSLSR
ncbi:hypothetical protein N9M16_00900 [Candidatus Dependentiae bacterium]|nr:hypothetical protein [Candidatus Dependentiae bacterium]